MEPTIMVKKEQNDLNSSTHGMEKEQNDFDGHPLPGQLESTLQKRIDVTSPEKEENDCTEDEDNQPSETANNQLVVYDPAANGTVETETFPDPIDCQHSPFPRYSISNQTSRVLPSVGAFTVQCANCFKWRLIPTKEKYEEIREHILEMPFVCETAREWRPEVSCDDPPDIMQDGSRLWAIDKPNIAQPPRGWQRLLRIRGEGSTKFADIYYVAPSGKRLRSMVEIQKYLLEHPQYVEEGATMSQFSFQIPRPLQENYVRKRPTRVTASHDGRNLGMPESLEHSEVNPIAWIDPDENTGLQLGGPGLSTPCFESPAFKPVNQPVKKARKTPSKQTCNVDSVNNQCKGQVEEPQ